MRGFNLLMAALAAGAAGSAAADEFYVERTEIAGAVTPQQRDFVQELIRSSIAARAEHEIAASQATADYVLQPKLIQHGDRYTVVIEKIDDGRILWAGRTDPVIEENLSQNVERLVQSMAEERGSDVSVTVITTPPPPSPPPAREELVQTEATEEKVVPLQQFSLAFGPTWLDEAIDDSGDPQLSLRGAYIWNLDYALLDLFGEFTFNGSEAGVVSGGVGASWLPLSKREFTPLLGAELGYGAVFPDGTDDSEGGFLVGGVIGAQFFRKSAVSLQVAYHFSWFTTDIGGDTPFNEGIRVGILFGAGD